jgi:hypothetical protein
MRTHKIVRFIDRDSVIGEGMAELDMTTRFLSADPMAEKYSQMSPYAYCANNPLINIDINGEWIYIMNDGQSYKYDEGKLYKYETEGDKAGTYSEFTAEEGSFLAGVLGGLNDLGAKSSNGSDILGFFANDDNDAYIKENSDNANSIETGTSGNAILLNPNLEGSEIPTEQGLQKSPFWLDIGHELSHRQDFILDSKAANVEWLKNPDTGLPIKDTEKTTTYWENRMREDAGLPLRTHYAAVTSSGMGWEPSRIINRNGYSTVFPGIRYLPLRERKKR